MSIHLKKLLSYTILVLIQVIFILVPSIDFLPYFNPTVSGKFITFLFIIEVATFLYFVRQLVDYRSVTISALDIIIALIAIYITMNRYVFQSNYSFSIRYYELLGLFALYFILRSNKNEKVFYSICIAAIIGADVQIIIGNLQLYGLIHSNSSFFKTTGGFFNSGPYAGYLASVFPISLFFLKNNKSGIFGSKIETLVKATVLFNLIGTFSIVPVLMSRACFISILLTIILIYGEELLSFFQTFIQKKAQKYFLFLILAACLVVGMIFLVSLKKESATGRYLILKTSSGMIADKPIFGFGFDRFRSSYMNYQAEYLKTDIDKNEVLAADNTSYAFNEPLQFVVENGIVGLILLTIFLFFLIKTLDKSNDLVRIAIVGLFAIFLFSLFSYPSEILPIKIVVFLYISLLASYNSSNFKIVLDFKKEHPISAIRWAIILPLLLLVPMLFYLSFTETINIESAFFRWNQADLKFNKRDYHCKADYDNLYYSFKKNGDFLTNYGMIFFFSKNYHKGIEVLKEAKLYIDNSVLENTLGDCQREIKDYKDAEQSYMLASDMTPGTFIPKFSLFKLYEESAQTSKAINMANELLKSKIKVQSEAIDAMRNEAKFFLTQRR